MSPLLRLMYCVSKRIRSVDEFSVWIIILLLEDWIDLIFPMCVGVIVWAKNIRIKIPRIERMKNIFSSFIWFGILLCLYLLICVLVLLLVRRILMMVPRLLLFLS